MAGKMGLRAGYRVTFCSGPRATLLHAPNNPIADPSLSTASYGVMVLTGLWVMGSLGVTRGHTGLWGHVGLCTRAPPLGHREPQSPLRKKSIHALHHRPTSPILIPNRSPHAPRPPPSPCRPMSPCPQIPPSPHTLPSPAQHSAPAGCVPHPPQILPCFCAPIAFMPPRPFQPHLCSTPSPAPHTSPAAAAPAPAPCG